MYYVFLLNIRHFINRIYSVWIFIVGIFLLLSWLLYCVICPNRIQHYGWSWRNGQTRSEDVFIQVIGVFRERIFPKIHLFWVSWKVRDFEASFRNQNLLWITLRIIVSNNLGAYWLSLKFKPWILYSEKPIPIGLYSVFTDAPKTRS